jgi:hypothetical protein
MEKEKVKPIVVNDYKTPCCHSDSPDWEGDETYLGNNGEQYPKIISHNKTFGELTIMNFNGEYSSYDWTEIHYCNKCNVEYQFENSSI